MKECCSVAAVKTSELGFKASGKGRGIENILIGGVAVLSAHTQDLKKLRMIDSSPCHGEFCIPLHFTSAWWFCHISLCALMCLRLFVVVFTGKVTKIIIEQNPFIYLQPLLLASINSPER